MSLTRQVADAINRRGSSTAADLLPEFPDCTLRQLIDALYHARTAGLVSLEKQGRNLGFRLGRELSTYGRPARKSLPAVSSVWDLGSRFAAQA